MKDMEFERANLKHLGYSKNVDIDAFKENCNSFVNNISNQCDKAYDMTDGKVSITPYILLDSRESIIYYDIKLNGLT